MPLRERNTLLVAAGFAPVYIESQLDAPELAVVGDALDASCASKSRIRRW